MAWFNLRWGVVLAGALSTGWVSAAPRSTYCCSDGRGHQVCGDVLPEACYGRAYREMDNQGVVRRQVDAPMTAEQLRKKREDDRLRVEEERRLKDQKRKDMALLNTYSSEQDIVLQRDQRIRELQEANKVAQQKLDEDLAQRTKLANEAEFYQKKEKPVELRNAMASNDAEIESLQASIDRRKKQIEESRARFDSDLQRYRELTRGYVRP